MLFHPALLGNQSILIGWGFSQHEGPLRDTRDVVYSIDIKQKIAGFGVQI